MGDMTYAHVPDSGIRTIVHGAMDFWCTITGQKLTPREKTPVRAVLTDFDGVIGDNNRTMRDAYETLKAHDFKDLPEWDDAKQFATHPLAFLRMQNLSDAEKSRMYTEGRAIYEHTPMHLLPGAVNTMNMYQHAGIPWAVVSNNHFTKERWQGEFGFAQMFPHVPVFDFAQKPDDRFMREALTALGQPAGPDVIMVDDNWKGLVAAAGMGLTPVYIGTKPHLVLPIVEKECRDRGIALPTIPVVRDNAELQQLVANGLQIGAHSKVAAL